MIQTEQITIAEEAAVELARALEMHALELRRWADRIETGHDRPATPTLRRVAEQLERTAFDGRVRIDRA